MDTTDKNIKKVFFDYSKNMDVDLEESIMDSIAMEKDYNVGFGQSRKRMKIGVIVSALFLIGYFSLIYFDTLPKINSSMKLVDTYLPTIFAAMIIVIMYFLSTYSFIFSKNKGRNSILPKL